MLKEPDDRWTTDDAADLYGVSNWGNGYFSVGRNGNVLVHPERDPQRFMDLKQLVDALRLRGNGLPLLLRFNGILQDRLKTIHDAFDCAIREFGYRGNYKCVFPIKVNQQRQVVEEIIEQSRQFGFGLEAGSKPELLAVIALADETTPIVCNGFKDRAYIEMAMLAQKAGRRVVPIVEKFSELELILRTAERVAVRPEIGMRVKLAARGSGRWQASGGLRSKFGLSVRELLQGFEKLEQCGMADCFKLLHFHLGSQITNIRFIKTALVEATRVYADLVKRGAGLETLDVGGGLGVDYDGSQSNFHSSMNYTLQEYANDVVYHILSVCDDAKVAHPNIISESGRAVAAYHSVLVFEVLGVTSQSDVRPPQPLPESSPQQLVDLQGTLNELNLRNVLESYHDAQLAMETAVNLFSTGHLSLDQRAIAESLYWNICRNIQRLVDDMEFVPEDLEGLDRLLAATYFCNFSLFQSIPDSWAIKQLFPLMPIHRLDEPPLRHAVLGDLTCDSDGKVDHFIDHREMRRSLQVHDFNGAPYYLAAFLVGAYQEILGDLHNLFGDTNAVHVNLSPDGEVQLESIIQGDSVADVLDYVQFDEADLMNRMQAIAHAAVRAGTLGDQEAGRWLKFYEEGLRGYTYLEELDE